MQEWLNWLPWKGSVLARVPWVRIPLSPQTFIWFKMNLKKIILLITLYFSISSIQAQSTENWESVKVDNAKFLFLNVTGLSSFQGKEFYVWTLEELKSPITIDKIDGDIFKIKTYYLFNKLSGRYSILQIIYYDVKGNVLKSFSYNIETDNPDFRYNHPLFKDSDLEKVYQKCLVIINQYNTEKK